MQVETNGQVASIAGMLELYSKRLGALQDELCNVSAKLSVLTSDLNDIIAVARPAARSGDIAHPQALHEEVAGQSAAESRLATTAGAVDDTAENIAIAAPVDHLIDIDTAEADDLAKIAGIDALAVETLHGFGIHSFAGIAELGADEATAIGMLLGDADRISRENWIEQAKILADGGLTAYARFVHTCEDRSGWDELAYDTLPASAIDAGLELAAAARIEAERPALQLIKGGKQPLAATLDDLVLEHDEVASELLRSAAVIACSIAKETGSSLPTEPEVAELPSSVSNVLAAAEADPIGVAVGTAQIIDLASRRKSTPRRRRPIAIAASLAVVIAAGTAMTISADRLLSLDLAAITSCGEALIAGNPSCLHLPASAY